MSAFFRFTHKLRFFFDWTYKVIMFLCKILLIGDIAITAWAVAGRYLPFLSDPHWSEEVVLTQMVYMTVLSAALAIRKGSHIRLSIYDRYLPGKMLTVSDLLADTGVLILGVVLQVTGIRISLSPLASLGRYASMPFLSKFWQYLSIPVAGAGMIIFETEQILQHLETLFTDDTGSAPKDG